MSFLHRHLHRALSLFLRAVGLPLALLWGAAAAHAQDKPAYRIFDRQGAETTYAQMVQAIASADVVFFGESHDDAMSHWLELQVLKSLHAQGQVQGLTAPRLTLAMEMFEADDQIVLDEYLAGTIEESHLLKEAKVWPNYKQDYKPLVEFAKANKLPVLASNVPRRYASLLQRKGLPALDALPAQAKQWIAPLPLVVDLELPGYKYMITTMGAKLTTGTPEDLARAQAIKDATMAHFIVQALAKGPARVLHVNGSYHSKGGEGILWYLKRAKPGLKLATLHVAAQEQVQALDAANKDLADFVIAVPKDMAKSY